MSIPDDSLRDEDFIPRAEVHTPQDLYPILIRGIRFLIEHNVSPESIEESLLSVGLPADDVAALLDVIILDRQGVAVPPDAYPRFEVTSTALVALGLDSDGVAASPAALPFMVSGTTTDPLMGRRLRREARQQALKGSGDRAEANPQLDFQIASPTMERLQSTDTQSAQVSSLFKLFTVLPFVVIVGMVIAVILIGILS